MVRISLLTFPVFSCGKWKKNICPNKTFLEILENYFFPSATVKRNNEIPSQSNSLGLRKERK